MKIVIDTNVVVSGIFFGGIPAQLLEKVIEKRHQIIVSEDIISEYIDIIHRITIKKQISKTLPMQALNNLINTAKVIDASSTDTPSCEDPDDIKFLQAAIAGKAKFLISGDTDLLNVGAYHCGRVIKPRDFCNL